jgi:hypothetical protein
LSLSPDGGNSGGAANTSPLFLAYFKIVDKGVHLQKKSIKDIAPARNIYSRLSSG